jgi:hypothetical protein
MQISAMYLFASPMLPQTDTAKAECVAATAAVPSTCTVQQVAAFEQQTGMRELDQAGFDISGLLTPQTRAQLYQLQGDGQLSGLGWVARTFDETEAAARSATGAAPASPTYLTNDDLAFIKKNSGYNLIFMPDGSSTFLDDQGDYPTWSEAEMRSARMLEGQMDTDRRSGQLKGSVDGTYLEGLFARFKEGGTPFDPDFEKQVLSQI